MMILSGKPVDKPGGFITIRGELDRGEHRKMEDYSGSGKTAVITGASSGIGLYSLMGLARQGVYVIGVGHNADHCKAAEERVRSEVPHAKVRYLLAELSLQREVKHLAAQIRRDLDEKGITYLDILINNAGIYSQKLTRTDEGIEKTLAVNHLAPFLLTHELLPLLEAAPSARVITVSSASHYHARIYPQRLNHPIFYVGFLAYFSTKLANVLFTYEFNRRLEGLTVRALALDPGLVNTNIALKEPGKLSQLVWKYRSIRGSPPEVPARTAVFLSLDESIQNTQQIYWREMQPKTPGRRAQDPDLARRLWEKSCQLCEIDW
jgi:NAD(P)-dependent dehydrogenase (short-subunit alcohol dehydrogenase family)